MDSAKSPDDRLASARWLVGSALVLGLAFEIFFYGHPPGISVPLWVGLCILALGLAARRHSVRGSLTGWLWAIPVLALSLVIPWRLEPLTLFLAVVLGLMALALLVDQFVPGDLMRIRLDRSPSGDPGHPAADARQALASSERGLARERGRTAGMAPAPASRVARLDSGSPNSGSVHGAVGGG